MNLPDNPMSMLRLMPSKDVEVARFSKGIIEAVKQGQANPLEVQVMLRALQAVAEEVIEEIDEHVVREAEKYAEKKFEAYGALVERTEVGVKYNYASSGDTIYERLQTDANTAKANLDNRTAFLRGLKEPMTVVDEMTGEVVTIKPPIKTSKTGVKVYLKHGK